VNLQARDSRVIWHPFTQVATSANNIPIVRAEGVWLYAEDGQKYLDGTASWWVNAHGHAHPKIAAAIHKQALTLEHIIFAGFTHQPAVELAEKLIELIGGQQSRIFYSDNGSTSVEVALKIALQFFHNQGTPRKKIIAFEQAYHGDTFGAMSVGHRNAFSAAFGELLFHVEFIPAPEKDKTAESLDLFSRIIHQNDVAAFIFEPLVQGANGMRMHDAEALSQMIDLARKNNVITIADEVFTGFYRTGKAFASNYLTAKPDLICLSKTLTGGTLPLGVTAVPEFIYDAFVSKNPEHTFFHGHSFTANPLSCSAAIASMELLLDETCQGNIQRITLAHETFIKRIIENKNIFEIRHLGTILAIELKTQTERGYLNPISKEITQFFLDRNIYLRPLGNVIYITPPYVISADELNLIYQAILEFLETIQ
jgi:adenosylmethionine-8-amino-7-oxononanoate aminotransferase